LAQASGVRRIALDGPGIGAEISVGMGAERAPIGRKVLKMRTY
jgi:hypothetical protein